MEEQGKLFLNRFKLLNKLGSGGYGQVYRALDITDNSYVAVKKSFGNGWTKERNIAEVKYIKALNSINSPHKRLIINMKTSFEFKKCIVLVLELMSHTLFESIHNDYLDSPTKLSKCAKQMMEFLCFMTQMNIIHGDIKPANILVHGPSGNIKFADFGLAQGRYESKTVAIQTLYYRAPEVMLGYDYDYSVDTWSMGCVLVECLIKKPLFKSENKLEVMQNIAQIIGMPRQEVIEQAPNRDKLFHYDVDSEQWLLIGYDFPIIPIGLKMFIKTNCNCDTHDVQLMRFIDLVEGMLQVEPSARYSAETCYGHPFFPPSDCSDDDDDCQIIENPTPEISSTSNGNKENIDPIKEDHDYVRDINELCYRTNVNKVAKLAAIKLYGRIHKENVIKKHNSRAVMIACIINETRNRRIGTSYKDLFSALGISVGEIGKAHRIIKHLLKSNARSRNIPQNQKYEIIDLTCD